MKSMSPAGRFETGYTQNTSDAMKTGAMFQRLWNPNVATVLVLIALAGPALWSVWMFKPRIERQPETVHTPRIRYILTDTAQDDGLWSPLLFSIPTPYGFSRTIQMAALETRGIPAVPIPPPPLMDFDRGLTTAAAERDDPLSESRLRAGLLPYRPVPEKPARPPAASGTVPLWRADAELTAHGFSPPDDWTARLPATPAPWSVTAVVEINQYGGVQNVFITEPHNDRELNAAVTKILRQGRIRANQHPKSGMITIAMP